VKDKIEIDRARRIANAASPTEAIFDGLQFFEQCFRR